MKVRTLIVDLSSTLCLIGELQFVCLGRLMVCIMSMVYLVVYSVVLLKSIAHFKIKLQQNSLKHFHSRVQRISIFFNMRINMQMRLIQA